MVLLIVFAGCQPGRPIYFYEAGDLQYYVDEQVDIVHLLAEGGSEELRADRARGEAAAPAAGVLADVGRARARDHPRRARARDDGGEGVARGRHRGRAGAAMERPSCAASNFMRANAVTLF